MDFLKKTLLFLIGGGGYVGLELLWRRRSHPTMFLLGGLCFSMLGQLEHVRPRLRPLAGCAICTAGELIFGILFNRDHRIWDYRGLPLNLMGQICPAYSLVWAALTVPAVPLYSFACRKLSLRRPPKQDFS